MRGRRHDIFIIVLTLLAFLPSPTSGQCASLYRCVNSRGSVMLTDNIPTNPDYKCSLAASYRESSPQERAQEQRETQKIMKQQEYQRKAQGDKQEYDNQMKQENAAQMKKKVELEKNYLENRRKALSSGSSKEFGQTVNKTMDKREEQLEKDPDQYFYDKEQREKASAKSKTRNTNTGPGGYIHPTTGQWVP